MARAAVLPVEPFTGQDFYVPAYSIRLGGRDLPELHDITSVSYSDSLTTIDSFELTVANWDPDRHTFKYSDGSTFRPWTRVELGLGYYRHGRDERRRMLSGEITTMTPSFPAGGGPTLGIRGLNLLHRFRLKQETKAYLAQKDTQIAQDLVSRIDQDLRKQFPQMRIELDPDDVKHNLKNEAEVPFLVMQNQYPIMFLMERARRIGYELVIRELPEGSEGRVILGFGPTSIIDRPTYILEWGVSLISVQPTLRVADQVNKVTVRGWNPRSKQPIQQTVTRLELKGERVVHPRDLDLQEPSLAQEVTVDRPVSSEREAKQYAQQILRQKASELVTAKAKTIGLPDLRAGVKVQLRGLGDRFSGPMDHWFEYVVTETTHTLNDGGYTTDFTARMEAPAS
jgi:phage protein D